MNGWDPSPSVPEDWDESAASLEPYLVDALDLAGAAITAALLVTAAVGVGGPVGVLLTLGFVTFVPGWAILDWVPIGEGISRVAIAVALSLTLCTAAAQALLWLHLWHPLALLYTLGSLSLGALASHIVMAGSFMRWTER